MKEKTRSGILEVGYAVPEHPNIILWEELGCLTLLLIHYTVKCCKKFLLITYHTDTRLPLICELLQVFYLLTD
jgi:hypothetical protein